MAEKHGNKLRPAIKSLGGPLCVVLLDRSLEIRARQNGQKLAEDTARDINLNIAVNDTNAKLTYYKFNAPALNTFSKSNADEWAAKEGFKIEKTIFVETFPLREIFNKNLKGNQKIDFMSIDVEGFDLKVLKSNDWTKYRPTLVLVEEGIYSYAAFEDCEIVSFMKKQNYSIYCITGLTIIFKDKRSCVGDFRC